MENATKALLLAAGVLITIIVITLGVTLYSTFSNQTRGYSQVISNNQVQKFNSRFIVFLGRKDITALEVVTAINLGKEYNVKILLDKEVFTNSEDFNSEDFNSEDFLKSNGDNVYECKIITKAKDKNPIFDSEGKIKQLKFTKKS